ncbi:2,3-diphosphoglycerate-dependent phosphoglycerate mutase [Streptomyces sp. NBC_00687]|uniref:2,3-bisphosphoglycerate-dependent phosphoglycerate mutase n=1 Tax=Streptomyces sp. NBC_00687 TaxID=2975807 RepID=UPI00225723B4|nr:2,3-bisphosphoglycerate-dependent phosphoglycerate mutase [Streptomyces sp. NBC_00687]MCX4919868.1 2,3-bisphosphoglycerate-dependent phosphoglycerate mutase [Streptomyces sp. NBC_00687]
MNVPGPLILLRHGQSTTNAEGRFTGWADVPLTAHGEKQAATAAQLLARDGLVPDAVHTSVLRRSIRTADILLDELDRSWIPVHRTWRLNERQYGALTGRVKREVRREVGPGQYRAWRRSLTAAPGPLPGGELARLRADPRYAALHGDGLPAVESLADMIARVAPYWADVLAGQLCSGRRVLVVAHGNALRALIAVLDRLTGQEIEELNIPTGAPLRYDFDRGLRPVVRGGAYLDPDSARTAAAAVAAEGQA